MFLLSFDLTEIGVTIVIFNGTQVVLKYKKYCHSDTLNNHDQISCHH